MRYVASLSLLALFACGGSSSNTATTTDQVAQLSIKSTGITTQTGVSLASGISVPNPGFVVFTNNDTAAHAIASSSPNCDALTTGTLAPGALSSQITLTNTTSADVTCSFNDTLNPSNTAFVGSVIILTTSIGTGSGY
jgi:hypothetical protein